MKKTVLFIFLLLNLLNAQDSFYAVKSGVLSHSTGPISSGIESGTDLNVELLFSKKFIKAYPSIGADINLNSDTSFVYAGLAWEGKFFKNMLLGSFLGLAVHNGNLEQEDNNKRNLGLRILFRGAIEIGYFINDSLSVSFLFDHYSHLGLEGKSNQGNDNMGLRLSYYL